MRRAFWHAMFKATLRRLSGLYIPANLNLGFVNFCCYNRGLVEIKSFNILEHIQDISPPIVTQNCPTLNVTADNKVERAQLII